MDKVIRRPRPKGTTELSITNNKVNNEESLITLRNHIIKSYVYTDYRYNGIKLNLEQFSKVTGIPSNMVYPFIMDHNKLQYDLMDKEAKEKLYGEMTGNILMGSLKDRLAVEQHAASMLESQGNSYKPFISGEVTKALKLLIESNNNLLNVHHRLFGQNAPTITINNNNQQAQSLSVLDAQMLIQSNQDVKPLLEDKPAQEGLYLNHNLSDMPEVNANQQLGMDTSMEGLNFAKVIMDANEGQTISLKDEDQGHIDRRANEYDVDLEQDGI